MSIDAVIAANRFGLGARPGELEAHFRRSPRVVERAAAWPPPAAAADQFAAHVGKYLCRRTSTRGSNAALRDDGQARKPEARRKPSKRCGGNLPRYTSTRSARAIGRRSRAKNHFAND